MTDFQRNADLAKLIKECADNMIDRLLSSNDPSEAIKFIRDQLGSDADQLLPGNDAPDLSIFAE